MTENKKVKNAKKHFYDGLTFKSGLEVYLYKRLQEKGLPFAYEPKKFILQDGFKLYKTIVYSSNTKRELVNNTASIINVTYTPDFYINKDGVHIYIDTKGFKNDSYPIKRKFFLSMLESSNQQFYFFEPCNQRQCEQVLEIINQIKYLDPGECKVKLIEYCDYMGYSLLESVYTHFKDKTPTNKDYIDRIIFVSKTPKYKNDETLKQLILNFKYSMDYD